MWINKKAAKTMRTVHDPFVGVDVQISDRLVDRLRGKYASGPHLPNGNPEFGWRQFQAPPIQHEAAARIEDLEAALREIVRIGECTSRVDDPCELWLVVGNMEGEALRVLNGVELAQMAKR